MLPRSSRVARQKKFFFPIAWLLPIFKKWVTEEESMISIKKKIMTSFLTNIFQLYYTMEKNPNCKILFSSVDGKEILNHWQSHCHSIFPLLLEMAYKINIYHNLLYCIFNYWIINAVVWKKDFYLWTLRRQLCFHSIYQNLLAITEFISRQMLLPALNWQVLYIL